MLLSLFLTVAGDPSPPVANESVPKMTVDQLKAPGGMEQLNVVDVVTLKDSVLPK